MKKKIEYFEEISKEDFIKKCSGSCAECAFAMSRYPSSNHTGFENRGQDVPDDLDRIYNNYDRDRRNGYPSSVYSCYYYQFKKLRIEDLINLKKCSQYMKTLKNESRVSEGIHLEREYKKQLDAKKLADKIYKDEKERANNKDKIIIGISIASVFISSFSAWAGYHFANKDDKGDAIWQETQNKGFESIANSNKELLKSNEKIANILDEKVYKSLSNTEQKLETSIKEENKTQKLIKVIIENTKKEVE